MNTKSLQSLCAVVMLAGLAIAGVGAWGTYHFGAKSAAEKQRQWALEEQRLNDKIASLEQANEELHSAAVPSPTPENPPQVSAKPKPTPALITSESGSSAPPPAEIAAKPRTSWDLSDKQYRQIVEMLGKHAGKTITIVSVESDTAGLAFAGALKRAFEEAGWHVDGVKQVSFAKPPVGLNLAGGSFPSPEGVVIAFRTLTSAGFNVSQQLDAKLAAGQAELIVGAMQ